MKTYIMGPTKSLIETLSQEIEPQSTWDYSRNLLIFPGKRPSYFLRKYLAMQAGQSIIPPDTKTFDSLITHYAEEMFPPTRLLNQLDSISILYDIHQSAPNRIGQQDFLSPDRFFPLGLKLIRDFEELYLEQVSPNQLQNLEPVILDQVKQYPEAWSKFTQRQGMLADYYLRFYQHLVSEGLSTLSLRYRQVLQSAKAPEFEAYFNRYNTIIVSGFFRFNKTEMALLKALDHIHPNLKIIFQEGKGLEEILTAQNINPIEMDSNSTAANPLPNIDFYRSPDAHGQVFKAKEILTQQNQINEISDEKTVIVLPSAETLFPLLQHTLAGYEYDSYNISMGYPLHRTPIFGFFSALIEAVRTRQSDGAYYGFQYMKFMLHPFTKNIYLKTGDTRRADLTRILIHVIEEHLLSNITRKFWRLDDIENDEPLQKMLLERTKNLRDNISPNQLIHHLKTIHEQTLHKFEQFSSVGQLAQQAKEVLDFIYANSTASRHPYFHPYAEAFMTELDALAQSMIHTISFQDIDGYFTFLKSYIENSMVPFSGTPLRGLQVLGFMETRNLQFDRVIVLDTNEDVLPASTREDSLLPYQARQKLGLTTYKDKEKAAGYYLDLLLKGSKESHLLFRESPKQQRSRFVEQLLWDRQQQDQKLDDSSYIQTIQYQVSLDTGTPAPISKTPEMMDYLQQMNYSASALDQYLCCPIRFYYTRVLRLDEKDVLSDNLQPQETGKFVHAVLQKYYEPWVGKVLSTESIQSVDIEKIIHREFTNTFGSGSSGSAFLMKRQIIYQLNQFLNSYQKPVLEMYHPTVLLGLEKKVTIDYPLEDGRTVKMKGFFDRIEQRQEKVLILDYKTGSTPLITSFAQIDELPLEKARPFVKSLQMPLYKILLEQWATQTDEDSLLVQAVQSQKTVDARYLMLGSRKVDTQIEVSPVKPSRKKSEMTPVECLKKVTDFIPYFLNEILNPEIPFNPTPELGNNCPGCPFNTLCGTRHLG